MLGKTHYKVGICYYLLSLPITSAFFAVNKIEHMAIGVLISAVASLLPDIDIAGSMITRKNPLTGIPIKLIDKLSQALLYLMRLAIFAGLGYLTWTLAEKNEGTAKFTLQCFTIILALVGICGGQLLRFIPVIGSVYKKIEQMVNNFGGRLKKISVITIVTLSVGAGFLYNYRTINDMVIYLFGGLIILSTLFHHRTLTHSTEGFLLFSSGALYISNLFGHIEFGMAFFVGYMSHLYLADIFTESGIPLSFIPYIIQKLGLEEKMKDNKVYKALSIRLRIKLMRTGSGWEGIYCAILIVGVVLMWKSIMI